MHHQRYLNKSNKFFQDNQSAIIMEMNGRNYCTGNPRHTNIRYFSIKYRLEKGDISIIYFLTNLILADYFIKLLQVALFHKFQDKTTGRVSPHTNI